MGYLHVLAQRGVIHATWVSALEPVSSNLAAMGDCLRSLRSKGESFLPAPRNILRAFRYPFDSVRVLIVGQDPYPTQGHPIGLSFAVDHKVRPLPGSLQNIYTEYRSDLNLDPPQHGDISLWSERGVMLLNRTLTVRPGIPSSHRGLGWEEITQTAVRALAARDVPLIAILWGRHAQELKSVLQSDRVAILESVHPSPMSATRGFFGSKPFSKANDLLRDLGSAPIDWRLT
ncbi:uracil-DNA glycosylase [Tropheryma whipplei]|uniref:Uracil-DNA glycosylase n=2 Tax=Tropheryma whipplei TaxID=2039 RepID=UNG_TROWT|nr:uracil-DNA glycosylase [Tropheryma whipplei]P67078.1 RecName: Full=Uracil-DNA glycosylase; Short=UDG [Tropheryma whipplei str. Twist]P67079.1 RecName: Full=Uracil-DNA glycosylase; Short=UDG [Tropheryma whipplei TW08/27]AAO44679.1 uracil-DNA glycosylase [Tropheryma whipplei str. Twist]MCO8182973.1 uracil-DNA glycosylase [Tropheryma whipplei]MCO8190604.1 uracil-DNA glycosylase [Tropheryma whipplei]CAD66858.1 uracil DNA glycosylase [Tropheryma whipplei TW08/27]